MYQQAQRHQLKPEVRSNGMRRRLRMLFFVCLCFFVWVGITLMGRMEVLDEKKSRLYILESKLSELQQENETYKHEVSRMNDPEYIEQMLRKEYQMTKEGETLFIKTK